MLVVVGVCHQQAAAPVLQVEVDQTEEEPQVFRDLEDLAAHRQKDGREGLLKAFPVQAWEFLAINEEPVLGLGDFNHRPDSDSFFNQ